MKKSGRSSRADEVLLTRCRRLRSSHFHPDHLGSPRIVTNLAKTTLARHEYFPFGEEATSPTQDDHRLKFTGHERDDLDLTGTTGDLDYMHARYFSAHVGRFMSVDPVLRNTRDPQYWNRYSYGRGNPMKYVDPTGAVVSLAGLNDTELQKVLDALQEATGNQYGVNEDGNLILVVLGDQSSMSATQIVEDLMKDERIFEVEACNDCGISFAGADPASNRIFIDFSDFQHLDFGNVTPGSFGLGVHLLHEGLHKLNPEQTDPSDPNTRGYFVDRINQARKERGFDRRDAYVGDREYGTVKIIFEAKGWRAAFGLRNTVTYPHDRVALGRNPL